MLLIVIVCCPLVVVPDNKLINVPLEYTSGSQPRGEGPNEGGGRSPDHITVIFYMLVEWKPQLLFWGLQIKKG